MANATRRYTYDDDGGNANNLWVVVAIGAAMVGSFLVGKYVIGEKLKSGPQPGVTTPASATPSAVLTPNDKLGTAPGTAPGALPGTTAPLVGETAPVGTAPDTAPTAVVTTKPAPAPLTPAAASPVVVTSEPVVKVIGGGGEEEAAPKTEKQLLAEKKAKKLAAEKAAAKAAGKKKPGTGEVQSLTTDRLHTEDEPAPKPTRTKAGKAAKPGTDPADGGAKPYKPGAKAGAKPEPAEAEPATPTTYRLRAGSFKTKENAQKLKQELLDGGHQATLRERTVKGQKVYDVQLGAYADKKRADKEAATLRADGVKAEVVH